MQIPTSASARGLMGLNEIIFETLDLNALMSGGNLLKVLCNGWSSVLRRVASMTTN